MLASPIFIARAKCYEVRPAAVGAGNVPGPWQTAGLFTNSRSMTVAGLVPGTTYSFQVRAVGGSTGYSDWSNPVSRMCA
jgi:chitodextrinase